MSKPPPSPADSVPDPVFDMAPVAGIGMRALHPQDGPLLLSYFAQRGLVKKADVFLAEHGLSRVHRRVLYAVARADGLSAGQLAELLDVGKARLQGPIKLLQDEGHIVAERDAVAHRSKKLRLTVRGARIEAEATAREREAMDAAMLGMSAAEQQGWRKIMTVLAQMA